MADRFTGQVMLCWPTDRKLIAQLNRKVGPGRQFVPTVEHTLSTCDACNRGIWIGPQQLQLVNSPFIRARKLCMFCTSEVQRVLDMRLCEVDVNLDLRHARRRTA